MTDLDTALDKVSVDSGMVQVWIGDLTREQQRVMMDLVNAEIAHTLKATLSFGWLEIEIKSEWK